MRLFGEQGYSATSVAQIEAAAGLSPGSGSLYKHFRSKEELLTAGLDRLLATSDRVVPPTEEVTDRPEMFDEMTAVVRAGLRRMATDRDLNRLLFRGLEAFPELLERFGDGEIGRIHRMIAALLADRAATADPDADRPDIPDSEHEPDWAAIAVVLQGATAHYWLLADLFGAHPSGVDEDRFVDAVATLAAARLVA